MSVSFSSVRRACIAATAAVAVVTTLSVSAPATAATPGPVSAVPVATTPNLNGAASGVPQTLMMRECAGQMWAVGSFNSIGSPGHTAVTRNNIFAFDRITGAVAAVDPNVNGTVSTIAFTPDCASAYIGGVFTSVGGVAVKNIAKFSTSTGAVDPTFGHTAPGRVSALLYANGHLLVGGYFTKVNGSTGTTAAYLTSVDPVTGKVDGYASNLGISGTLPNDTTHVYKMWLDPASTRVAVDGVFTSVLGQARRQIFMLDLGASSVSLDPWFAPVLNQACQSAKEQFYTKSLAWSPDGASLYVASTGYRGATLCDTVAKFSASASSNQSPVWINRTGGDSLFAVVATSTDVYVGGHQRWLNNPLGNDSCGAGCVARPGIGDVDPTTGLVTPWDPTRSRGHGASDLFIDSAGDLWVSSDAPNGQVFCAGVFHPGICEFPAAS